MRSEVEQELLQLFKPDDPKIVMFNALVTLNSPEQTESPTFSVPYLMEITGLTASQVLQTAFYFTLPAVTLLHSHFFLVDDTTILDIEEAALWEGFQTGELLHPETEEPIPDWYNTVHVSFTGAELLHRCIHE